MDNYEVTIQLPEIKRQNIGQWNTNDISLATTADNLTIVSNNELTQEQIDALVLKIQSESVKPALNLDVVDQWLDATFGGTALEDFGSVVFRATSKNTKEGYALMVKKANDISIPQNIIDTVTAKLAELGANI